MLCEVGTLFCVFVGFFMLLHWHTMLHAYFNRKDHQLIALCEIGKKNCSRTFSDPLPTALPVTHQCLRLFIQVTNQFNYV